MVRTLASLTAPGDCADRPRFWVNRVFLAVLAFVGVPGAFARVRGQSRAEASRRRRDVDNCLAVDATGVACCNRGADCGAAGTAEMADWDVSLVTDMSYLFNGKGSFNADISRWDVSSVTNMQGMFYEPTRSTDNRWDVARHDATSDANVFNADVGWDVSGTWQVCFLVTTAASWDISLG